MANVEKWSQGGTEVLEKLRHSNRSIKNPSNPDIDAERTHLNYSLTPDHGGMDDYEYYQKRLSEVYVYDKGARADETVTCAGWIVTLPEGDYTREEERAFFEAAAQYLSGKFGGPDNRNTVSIYVHYDEGKMAYKKDEDGDNILDSKGHRVPEEFRVGRPHLHYNFVPCTDIDHDREHAKRWHDPKIDYYDEKLCASEVLNKRTLREFHPQLQQYLDDHGLDQFRVINGRTAKQGLTVEQLKHRTALENRIAELEIALSKERELVKALALENREIKNELEEMLRTNAELQLALNLRREAEHINRWTTDCDRSDRSNRWE